jgi:hypothetical protein
VRNVFKKQDLIYKIISTKKARGMAQVVEYVPRKHKALRSNPSKITETQQQKKDNGLKLDS